MASGRYPSSRNHSTATDPCRFDSGCWFGPTMSGRCAYAGGEAPNAPTISIWRGVDGSRSSPRMTWVIRILTSSTAAARR